MTRHIRGIAEISDRYDAFIIDIFGVLHDGLKAFPDARATLEAMKTSGKKVCLLSNSPRRAHNASKLMHDLSLPRDLYDHIVTSGENTYDYISNHYRGQRCWFLGRLYVDEAIEGSDIILQDAPEGADFILNSIPGSESKDHAKLGETMARAVKMDLPMICANPDLIVHIGDTIHECAGTFAKIYEDMGGRVVYHGKPYAPVYERCHGLLGKIDKRRICAIGDSLHTDIAGANNFGIDGILNLAGIHREEITPENLSAIDDQPHKPTYLIDGFKW